MIVRVLIASTFCCFFTSCAVFGGGERWRNNVRSSSPLHEDAVKMWVSTGHQGWKDAKESLAKTIEELMPLGMSEEMLTATLKEHFDRVPTETASTASSPSYRFYWVTLGAKQELIGRRDQVAWFQLDENNRLSKVTVTGFSTAL